MPERKVCDVLTVCKTKANCSTSKLPIKQSVSADHALLTQPPRTHPHTHTNILAHTIAPLLTTLICGITAATHFCRASAVLTTWNLTTHSANTYRHRLRRTTKRHQLIITPYFIRVNRASTNSRTFPSRCFAAGWCRPCGVWME